LDVLEDSNEHKSSSSSVDNDAIDRTIKSEFEVDSAPPPRDSNFKQANPSLIENEDVTCKRRVELESSPLRSEMECYGHPGSVFERYCRFKNVCYQNKRFLVFNPPDFTNATNFHFPRFSIYPGVGTRRRNGVEFISVVPVNAPRHQVVRRKVIQR